MVPRSPRADLDGIVAKEAVEKFGDLKKAESVVGTGPWMLERYDTGAKLVYVRNPHYFMPGLPYADGVDVVISPDPASAFADFITGKLDVGPEYGAVVRRIDLDSPRRRSRASARDFTVVFGGVTWMKLGQEPFRDVRVRRALGIASNWREVLETNAWSQGHGSPNPAIPAALKEWSIPIDQLPPEGRRLYDGDPAAAKRCSRRPGTRRASRCRSRRRRAMARTTWTPCRSGSRTGRTPASRPSSS